MQAQVQIQSPIKRHLSPLHAMLGMLEVQRDASKLNKIVNHPAVRPWIAERDEPVDMAPAFAARPVICLLAKHGGVSFELHQVGLWEAHTVMLPEGRGAWALDCARAALHWMFTRTDAVEIATRCPQGNLAAKALARAVGGTYQFTNPHGWVQNGKPIPADIYSLDIKDWMRRAPGLIERGRWFHRRLDEEMRAFDRPPPPHADDDTHDRYVGAACEMMLGGWPGKAVTLYNRWAVLAGYLPIGIVSTDPLQIDIRSAVIELRDDDFKVMSVEALH